MPTALLLTAEDIRKKTRAHATAVSVLDAIRNSGPRFGVLSTPVDSAMAARSRRWESSRLLISSSIHSGWCIRRKAG
ncbi:hypothetical protein VTN02DRAFT_5655 [Thermoascus thermophilus]